MRRRTLATTLACLVAVLMGLHVWLIDGVEGALLALGLPEDTVYTAGYSEAGFRKVAVGMSETEVVGMLGPPQARWSIVPTDGGPDTGARWSHSPGDTNYRCRVVLYRHGRVLRRHAEFHVD